jgi:hypothetical protein
MFHLAFQRIAALIARRKGPEESRNIRRGDRNSRLWLTRKATRN